jgi:methionine-rich copper-binding protein CopC
MQRFPIITLGTAFACIGAPAAFAHAFLDRAVPAVGSTVQGSPGEIRLVFSEAIVPAFAGVQIATAEGAPVEAGKPAIDAANPAVLHVLLGHPLRPGVYKVTWHVVAVDTHRTEGSYIFTVMP